MKLICLTMLPPKWHSPSKLNVRDCTGGRCCCSADWWGDDHKSFVDEIISNTVVT